MPLDLSNLEKPGVKAAGAVPTPVQSGAPAGDASESHVSEISKPSLPAEAVTPEDSLDAAFVKLGGKRVRGATPKPAEPAEPHPDLFQELGGRFVGKIPAAAPPSAKE